MRVISYVFGFISGMSLMGAIFTEDGVMAGISLFAAVAMAIINVREE